MTQATSILACLSLLCVAAAGCGGKSKDVNEPDPGASSSGPVEGELRTMSLAEAIEACPEGTRLPTNEEYKTMLGGCGESHCNSCAQSEACTQMFGGDDRGFWTMTGGDLSIAGQYARFHDGYVNIVLSNQHWHVRCVWDETEGP